MKLNCHMLLIFFDRSISLILYRYDDMQVVSKEVVKSYEDILLANLIVAHNNSVIIIDSFPIRCHNDVHAEVGTYNFDRSFSVGLY